MTAMLKEGFAPYEQYSGHGQGAWSDLYSLCATIYYCLTGKVPPSAMNAGAGSPDPTQPAGGGTHRTAGAALLKGLAYGRRIGGKAWENSMGPSTASPWTGIPGRSGGLGAVEHVQTGS